MKTSVSDRILNTRPLDALRCYWLSRVSRISTIKLMLESSIENTLSIDNYLFNSCKSVPALNCRNNNKNSYTLHLKAMQIYVVKKAKRISSSKYCATHGNNNKFLLPVLILHTSF